MNMNALNRISYGMYIICSKKGNEINGQIANTLFQVTAEPQKVAISINKNNLTHDYIKESKLFTASVLSKEAPLEFIGNFGFKSGRDIDKFKKVKIKLSNSGIPIVLDYTLAYIEAKVVDSLDAGTHTIFIGKVIDADIIDDGEPMSYDYYHKIKGGYSPKNAPTYIGKTEREESKMSKYRCKICGYIYDPEKGDPDNGIKPGTAFGDLPDDWVCPVCGASKDQFVRFN